MFFLLLLKGFKAALISIMSASTLWGLHGSKSCLLQMEL